MPKRKPRIDEDDEQEMERLDQSRARLADLEGRMGGKAPTSRPITAEEGANIERNLAPKTEEERQRKIQERYDLARKRQKQNPRRGQGPRLPGRVDQQPIYNVL